MLIRDIIRKILLESFEEDEIGRTREELEIDIIGSKMYNIVNNMLIQNNQLYMDNGFDFIKWCKQFIGPVEGHGFSRVTFKVPDRPGLLFKIARNFRTGEYSPKGATSNRQEVMIFRRLGGSDLFPKVFNADPLGNWFIVEKVDIIENDINGYANLGKAIKKESVAIKNLNRTLLRALPQEERNQNALDVLLSTNTAIENYENPHVYFYFKFVESDLQEFIDVVGEAILESDPNGFIDNPYHVASNIYGNFLRDPFLNKLKYFIMSLGINGFDLGPGNVGISALDGKFKIIDVSIIVR